MFLECFGDTLLLSLMYLMQIVSQVGISEIPVLNIAERILTAFPIKRRGKRTFSKLRFFMETNMELFFSMLHSCVILNNQTDLRCFGSLKMYSVFIILLLLLLLFK